MLGGKINDDFSIELRLINFQFGGITQIDPVGPGGK